MRRMLNENADNTFDRFKDALMVRAQQIATGGDVNNYIAGYLFSFLEYGHDYETHIAHLEKLIAEWKDPKQDEQTLVDLLWQHEPLRSLDNQ